MPPELPRLEAGWHIGEQLRLAPTLEWTRQDYYVDHANTVRAPSYAIWGLRLSGSIGEPLSWFADACSLGDRAYIATTGVVADARGRDGAYFLPGDGRSIYAGLEWPY